MAYLLRYDVRPEIPRERAPSRRWLIVPLGSFLLYMILTADILLVVAIVTAAIWGVRDDMSIYRHRSHEHPTG